MKARRHQNANQNLFSGPEATCSEEREGMAEITTKGRQGKAKEEVRNGNANTEDPEQVLMEWI
jgi:hypothetical protein